MHKLDIDMMRLLTRPRTAIATLALLTLAACGGGDGGGGGGGQGDTAQATSDPTVAVAPAASTDAAVATSYTASLASTPPSTTDTLDPLPVPAQLATDDTGEPAPVAH